MKPFWLFGYGFQKIHDPKYYITLACFSPEVCVHAWCVAHCVAHGCTGFQTIRKCVPFVITFLLFEPSLDEAILGIWAWAPKDP